jgi:hypothetical protein
LFLGELLIKIDLFELFVVVCTAKKLRKMGVRMMKQHYFSTIRGVY